MNKNPYQKNQRKTKSSPYRWAWEQVHGKKETRYSPRTKCNRCIQGPDLRQTGWPDPRSWFCPICGAVFSDHGNFVKTYRYILGKGLKENDTHS